MEGQIASRLKPFLRILFQAVANDAVQDAGNVSPSSDQVGKDAPSKLRWRDRRTSPFKGTLPGERS